MVMLKQIKSHFNYKYVGLVSHLLIVNRSFSVYNLESDRSNCVYVVTTIIVNIIIKLLMIDYVLVKCLYNTVKHIYMYIQMYLYKEGLLCLFFMSIVNTNTIYVNIYEGNTNNRYLLNQLSTEV